MSLFEYQTRVDYRWRGDTVEVEIDTTAPDGLGVEEFKSSYWAQIWMDRDRLIDEARD